MSEENNSITESKFISSLVKSLQILCNGQVDFSESIEIVGYINVKVDRKHKFDYVVDEHVSKEGNDSSTTFVSNSYHSLRHKQKSSEQETLQQTNSWKRPHADTIQFEPENNQYELNNFAVKYSGTSSESNNDQIVIKEEGDDQQLDDCMVLSAPREPHRNPPIAGTSKQNKWSLSEQKMNVSGSWLKDVKPLEQTQREEIHTSYPRICYSCSCCQSNFASESEFQAHSLSRVCKQPCILYTCSQCFLCSEDRFSLQQHVDSNCSEYYNNMFDRRILSCKFCSASFKSSTGLKKHIQVKHGTQSSSSSPALKCPICDKIMYNKINLDGHINQHKGVKPHICTFCGRGFSYKQSLQAHVKLCTFVSTPPSEKCEI